VALWGRRGGVSNFFNFLASTKGKGEVRLGCVGLVGIRGGGSKGVTLVGRQVDAWVGGYRIVLRSVRRKMLAWVRVHRGALAGLNRIQSLHNYTGSAESANVTSERIKERKKRTGNRKRKETAVQAAVNAALCMADVYTLPRPLPKRKEKSRLPAQKFQAEFVTPPAR
jgi:hypothetical protein